MAASARPLAPIWARLIFAAAAGALAGVAAGPEERVLLAAAVLAPGLSAACELGRAAPRAGSFLGRAAAIFAALAASVALRSGPPEIMLLPAGLIVGLLWARRTPGGLDQALALAGGCLAVVLTLVLLAKPGVALLALAWRPGPLGAEAAGATIGFFGFVALGILENAKPLWDEVARPGRVAAALFLAIIAAAYEAPVVIVAAGTDHSDPARCRRYNWARDVVLDRLNVCYRGGLEGAAIGCLRTLVTAQALFREGDKDRDGALDYARSLDELVAARLVAFGPKADSDPHARFGYRVEVTSDGARWSATAVPSCSACTEGGRSFFVDETGVIRFSTTGAASATSATSGL